MVERSQSAGWMPSLYEPIKKAGQRIVDWFAPRSDAAVSDTAYEIAMELPGVEPEHIDIAVQDSMIIVTGEKRFEREETGKNYLFSEREFGAFQRAFRIPPDADAGAIDAEFMRHDAHQRRELLQFGVDERMRHLIFAAMRANSPVTGEQIVDTLQKLEFVDARQHRKDKLVEGALQVEDGPHGLLRHPQRSRSSRVEISPETTEGNWRTDQSRCYQLLIAAR